MDEHECLAATTALGEWSVESGVCVSVSVCVCVCLSSPEANIKTF